MATKNRALIIAITAIIISWFFAIPTSAQSAVDSVEVTDTIMVQFDAKTSTDQRMAAIEEMGGKLVNWIAPINVAVIQVQNEKVEESNTSKSAQTDNMLSAARSAADVIFAEADGIANAAFSPNDPDFYSTSLVYAPQRINADKAWDFTLGSLDITVAILDTGVNYNHPEFAGRIVAGYDFINDDNDPMDDNGHGTHVAGTAAAGTNNGIGNVGICGNCSLMPVKILSNTGSGLWSQVAAGVIFATDNGANVINLSLGGYSASSTLQAAVEYAQDHGVIVVAAAGNDHRNDPFYPAAFQDVIGVSATNSSDQVWSLSNYGDYVDVAAPGVIIYNTYHDLSNYYGGYAFYSGTSMAAPHVTGLVGLILSQAPARTLADVMQILTSSGDDLGAAGYDIYYGNGRIDAFAALSQDVPPTAALSGQVWLDNNNDQVQNDGTNSGIVNVAINVTAADGTAYNVNTAADGSWQIGSLPQGTYTVQMTVPGGYFETGNTSRTVSLSHGQQMTGINFGLTDMLPADSIDSFKISRDGSTVTIEWIITRNEVQVVTVERGINESEGFVNVGELMAQVVGTNTVIKVTDQLPAEMADATVYYRLRIEPTGLVVGPLASISSSSNQIFLPMVVNR